MKIFFSFLFIVLVFWGLYTLNDYAFGSRKGELNNPLLSPLFSPEK